MATKILCVSLVQDKIDLLRVEKRVNTYRALGQPTRGADENALGRACRWADEILLNSEFPAAAYRWATFPKVQKRYLTNIIKRDAVSVLDVPGGTRVAFKAIKDVVEEGVTKRYLSYVAVSEDEITQLENELFAKYVYKIKSITTLPVALCAALIQTQKPDDNFMLIWVGENTTVMAICSPTGEIYVARHIPVGFTQEGIADPAYMERFSDEVRRDIASTTLFHTQSFPNTDCQKYYMIGNVYLQNIFSEFPIPELSDQIHFGLPHSPISGLQDANVNEAAHLVGSLFCQKEFNLVDPRILLNKTIERVVKTAIWAVAVLVILAGAYLFRVEPVSSEKISHFGESSAEYQTLQTEVASVQKDVHELNRFSGWKTFYKNTYKNQPAWNRLFFDLAESIPPKIVVDAFQVTPGKGKEVHGWSTFIKGHIKDQEWNKGLELLREFGANIHRSPHFSVESVDYTPIVEDENSTIANADFEFQINIRLTPQDTVNEK